MKTNEKELERIVAEDCLSIVYRRISEAYEIPTPLNYSVYSLYYDYMNKKSNAFCVDFNIFIAAIICVLKLNEIEFDLTELISITKEILQNFYDVDKSDVVKHEILMLRMNGFYCLTKNPYALFDFVPDQYEVDAFFHKYETNELFYILNSDELFFLFFHNRGGFVVPYKDITNRIDMVLSN